MNNPAAFFWLKAMTSVHELVGAGERYEHSHKGILGSQNIDPSGSTHDDNDPIRMHRMLGLAACRMAACGSTSPQNRRSTAASGEARPTRPASTSDAARCNAPATASARYRQTTNAQKPPGSPSTHAAHGVACSGSTDFDRTVFSGPPDGRS